MASKAALTWLCLISVVSFSGASDTPPLSCSSTIKNLTAHLQMAADCAASSEWSSEQTAELLNLVRNLVDLLQEHQLKDCQNAEPKKCQPADIPANGGLLCVTAANKRICKPMCNSGHDFAFIRISRLFEECSEQTNHSWSTQYVGGSRLAVCNKESIQVAGATSAYFPQDCLTTKSSSELRNGVIGNFTSELNSAGMVADAKHVCIFCG